MNDHLWLTKIKAIGWDLDGTLYPPNSIPTNIIQNLQYQAVMKKNGWNKDQAIKEFQLIYKRLGSHTKTLTKLGVDGTKFFTTLWDNLPLEKYIKKDHKINEVFSKLSNKKHFIITNSNTISQVEKKLKLIGLPISNFEFIITTDKLGVVKPDPKPFAKAIRKLQFEPNEILFIGDRVTTDIRGGKNIGMKTCLVYSENDEADISLKNIYQIPKIFQNYT